MPRLMAFALTEQQMLDKTKTVTRRRGWSFLKEGDTLYAVNKTMGFKKGEKPSRLGMIRVVSVTSEPLNRITPDDVVKEGFTDWTPAQFIEMVVNHYNIQPSEVFNRIEFEHIESFQPSNGNLGAVFFNAACMNCKKLKNGYCRIQAETMFFNKGDPNYPWQWQQNSKGEAWCAAFKDKAAGGAA